MTSHWISNTNSALVRPAGHRLPRPPPDPPRRAAGATAPRPLHTVALGGPGETRGAAVELGEREAWEGGNPGTACSVPGKGGVSIIFGGISLSGFFACPRLWVPMCMESAFSGNGTLSSPPPVVFCIPVVRFSDRALDFVRPSPSLTIQTFFFASFNCRRILINDIFRVEAVPYGFFQVQK